MRFINVFLPMALAGLVASCSGPGGATPQPGPPAQLDAQINIPTGALNTSSAAPWMVTIAGGTAPFTVTWNFGGGAVEDSLQQTAVTSNATTVLPALLAGSWTATVIVADAKGETVTEHTSYVVHPPSASSDTFTPAANALYAIPLTVSAAVDEEVTIEIVTGILPHMLIAAGGIGVVTESDATYVPHSFNIGAAGGATYDADGIWAGSVGNGDFLTVPDAFIGSTSLASNTERYDFTVLPLGPGGADNFAGVAGKSGAICNFKLKYSTPGTKTLRFEVYNGAERTCYQASSGSFAPLHWGDTSNDGSSGAANSIIIAGPPPVGDLPDPPGHAMPAGFTPAADTLYAIPQAATAAVGEEVTVAIVAGPSAHPCRYPAVGLIVADDATYVLDSFNAGELGGYMYGVDGIWAGLLDPADPFVPSPNAHDLGGDTALLPGGLCRLDLGATPRFFNDVGDITGTSGVLFSIKLKFSTPGTKTFGFEAFNNVRRTYYSDAANNYYDWSNIANDGTAVPNSIVIH